MADFFPITQFDLITLSPQFQILKAMIPFLDYPTQKTLSLLVRIEEFQETMKYYRNYHPSHINNLSPKNNSSNQSGIADNDILNAILPYCPKQYSDMLNTISQAMQMSELFKLMPEDSGLKTPPPADYQSPAASPTSEAPSHIVPPHTTPTSTTPTSTTPTPTSGNGTGASLNPMLASLLNKEQTELYNKYIKELDKFNL